MREAKSVTPARCMASSASIRWEKRLAVSCTVSRTVMSGRRPAVCMTAATRPRSTAWRGLIPKTLASPLVGRLSPRIMSIVVVLPAPLGPRRATTSPGRMVRSTPSTAVTSPKVLCRSVSRTASTWSVRGTSGTEASRPVRGVAVLMAQDSSRVGCGPWPIGHHLLMTYLRGRQAVKYRGIPGKTLVRGGGLRQAEPRPRDMTHTRSPAGECGLSPGPGAGERTGPSCRYPGSQSAESPWLTAMDVPPSPALKSPDQRA